MRTLLVLFSLSCLWLGFYAHRACQQREAVAAVTAAGGVVYYSHQRVSLKDPPTAILGCVARILGEEWAYSVEGVIFYPDEDHSADELVRVVSIMPHLERLSIWPEARGNKTIDAKASFGITNAGVDYIVEHLLHLQHLNLMAARVSDDRIDQLLQLEKLTSLQIQRPPGFGVENAVDTYEDETGSDQIIDRRQQ